MKDGVSKAKTVKAPGARFLMVVAPYYEDIADQLQAGAEAAAAEGDATLDRIVVPGAFEIPGGHRAAARQVPAYEGFVALGCVVRGETSHYDYVCGESARALMDLSMRDGLSIGYGDIDGEHDRTS